MLLLPQGHFTISIDLKDGYWHVPIAPSKRLFQGFVYQGTSYQFRALPFRMNLAPRNFTKLVNHIVQVVCGLGIFMLTYLDNLLISASTATVYAMHLQTVLHVLADHG